MFIKNNHRFNIHAYISSFYMDEAGIQHPGSRLLDEEFRMYHGITEIPDPVRGDDETQYTTEIDVDPWVIITDKPIETVNAFKIKRLTDAIQDHLNITAQSKGYDNIHSAAIRAGFTGPFQTEGIAYAQWMDACWAAAFQVLEDFNNQVIPNLPTIEEAIAALPAAPTFP